MFFPLLCLGRAEHRGVRHQALCCECLQAVADQLSSFARLFIRLSSLIDEVIVSPYFARLSYFRHIVYFRYPSCGWKASGIHCRNEVQHGRAIATNCNERRGSSHKAGTVNRARSGLSFLALPGPDIAALRH